MESPIWRRPVSRRAVLAAGAAGAAAAAVAGLWRGSDISRILGHAQDLTNGAPNPFTSERIRVAHLFRRAGFGATTTELDQFSAMGAAATADHLLNFGQISNQDLENRLSGFDPMGKAKGMSLPGWWLQRMTGTARPLEEKMTLFWHGLLTSGLDKAGPAQLYQQNQLFRKMALGNFDELLKAVSKDPAMMIYLDSENNRKGKPNENYARELMELFTTGIGHYSEDDVRESARAFTGWTLSGGKARDTLSATFVPRYHDDGIKTFMGKRGNFTGDDIVEMLVPMRATAERLSTKLFSFFAYPNPEKEVVQHLADVFQKQRYNVGAVVKEIFTMDQFYSARAYRGLIKSPAEYVAQVSRATETASAAQAAVGAMGSMGQSLFYPPNVAGWPSGSSWINSSTLLYRINYANGASMKSSSTLKSQSLDQLLKTLVDGNVAPGTRQSLEQFASAHPNDRAGLIFFVLATPDYQLN
jgi:uncharacterized protein (DUF1800 family)